jgi:hypothetical protein
MSPIDVSSAPRALLGSLETTPAWRGRRTPMTHRTETATEEPTIVTVFEHHDADGADLDVAIVRTHRWQFLTVEEARDLANMLLDAADVAEECSEESEIPLRTRR